MAFAETFKALSHPIRREILTLLKENSLIAGEIASHFRSFWSNYFAPSEHFEKSRFSS